MKENGKSFRMLAEWKHKKYLIWIVLFLFFYSLVIWKYIYDNILEIELMNVDVESKFIEKQILVWEIIRLKDTQVTPQEIDILNEQKMNLESINKNINLILDFKNSSDDDSILKFVTSNKSFTNKQYIPAGLVHFSSDYVYDSKWWSQYLRDYANQALQKMAKQFYNDFWEKMVVVSAYRSYEYQKWIKDNWCPDNLCAKAWYSEHQSGLAVDLWEASTNAEWKNNQKLTSYYDWLSKNAYKYGFHNTYQKWLEIDWYEIEPWHWRYLWVEFATYLKENNITIAEYYNK